MPGNSSPRHLDPGEAPLAAHRIADHHPEVQREVGDVGEGVPGVDGQRGQDGEDPLGECLDQELLVLLVELGPGREPDPGVGQGRCDPLQEHRLHVGERQRELVPDVEQLLGRGAPVRAGDGQASGQLVLERGHPDLEELVEVLAEDGQELAPLEHGDPLVLRQGQNPLVEVEPGQLAIQVAGGILHSVKDTNQPLSSSS
jgi:hypothetical protein